LKSNPSCPEKCLTTHIKNHEKEEVNRRRKTQKPRSGQQTLQSQPQSASQLGAAASVSPPDHDWPTVVGAVDLAQTFQFLHGYIALPLPLFANCSANCSVDRGSS